jgi:hypothetical protein
VSDLVRSWEIELPGSDCETCGYTPQRLAVDLDGATATASYTVGCFGGDSKAGAPAEVSAWLLDLIGGSPDLFHDWHDDVRLIAEELARLTPALPTEPIPEGTPA